MSWLFNIFSSLIPKSQFSKNIAKMAGGTGLGQVLLVLATPILTRLYDPHEFGVFFLFVSVLGVFGVVSSLRYSFAIPLPKDDETAINLLVLSLAVVLLLSCLIGGGLWVFWDWFVTSFKVFQLKPYFWFVPLGVFTFGTFQVFQFWAIRKKAFGKLGYAKFYQAFAILFTQILLGIKEFGPAGLIIGQIIGQALGIFWLSRLIFGKDKIANFANIRTVVRVARRYRKFPLVSSFSGLINTLSSEVPILFISFFFGPAVVGLYGLGYRVLQTPASLISQAIAHVFYSTAAEKIHSGVPIGTIIKSILPRLVQICFLPFVLIGLAAPELFSIIFGDQWKDAGIYAQWMSPWVFFTILSNSFSFIPSLVEKQEFDLIFHSWMLITRIIALSIGVVFQSPTLSIFLLAFFSSINLSAFIFWVMRFSKVNIADMLRSIFDEILSMVPFMLPLILLKVVGHEKTNYDIFVAALYILSGSLWGFRLFRRFKQERFF